MQTDIRPARPQDAATIVRCIRDLAEYEKLLHEVVIDEAAVAATFFCDQPKVFALILEADGEPVGFAVYFYNYSTFLGRHGIWIEDVYVDPKYRSHGLGKAVFNYLSQKALDEGCGRVEWWVVDWNEPAIAFYQKMGAEAMTDWTVQRLAGDALQSVAGKQIKKAS